MIVALVITLVVNVPIDNQIKVWTLDSLPGGWQQVRDRWEGWHAVRTFISIGSFVCQLVSLFTSKN